MKIEVNILFSILLSRKFQILKEILSYFFTKHLLNSMNTFIVKHFAKKFLRIQTKLQEFPSVTYWTLALKTKRKHGRKSTLRKFFKKKLWQILWKNLKKIHRTLHLIKDNLKGFKTPFDVDNKISRVLISGVIHSGAGFGVSVVLYRIAKMAAVLVTVAAVGVCTRLVMAGLEKLDLVDDFDTECSNAFSARVNFFTVEEIQRNLTKAYFYRIKEIMETFLEGDLKREIERINDNISRMRDEQALFKLKEETLSSLQSTVIQKIELLQQIERIDITTE